MTDRREITADWGLFLKADFSYYTPQKGEKIFSITITAQGLFIISKLELNETETLFLTTSILFSNFLLESREKKISFVFVRHFGNFLTTALRSLPDVISTALALPFATAMHRPASCPP